MDLRPLEGQAVVQGRAAILLTPPGACCQGFHPSLASFHKSQVGGLVVGALVKQLKSDTHCDGRRQFQGHSNLTAPIARLHQTIYLFSCCMLVFPFILSIPRRTGSHLSCFQMCPSALHHIWHKVGAQEKPAAWETESVTLWVRENIRFGVEAGLPPFNSVGWVGKEDVHDLVWHLDP